MTDNTTALIMRMRQLYPFQAFFHRYREKLKAGKAPRPESVTPEPNASWVVRCLRKDGQVVDVVRAFGFKTGEDAAAFVIQWPEHGNKRWRSTDAA